MLELVGGVLGLVSATILFAASGYLIFRVIIAANHTRNTMYGTWLEAEAENIEVSRLELLKKAYLHENAKSKINSIPTKEELREVNSSFFWLFRALFSTKLKGKRMATLRLASKSFFRRFTAVYRMMLEPAFGQIIKIFISSSAVGASIFSAAHRYIIVQLNNINTLLDESQIFAPTQVAVKGPIPEDEVHVDEVRKKRDLLNKKQKDKSFIDSIIKASNQLHTDESSPTQDPLLHIVTNDNNSDFRFSSSDEENFLKNSSKMILLYSKIGNDVRPKVKRGYKFLQYKKILEIINNEQDFAKRREILANCGFSSKAHDGMIELANHTASKGLYDVSRVPIKQIFESIDQDDVAHFKAITNTILQYTRCGYNTKTIVVENSRHNLLLLAEKSDTEMLKAKLALSCLEPELRNIIYKDILSTKEFQEIGKKFNVALNFFKEGEFNKEKFEVDRVGDNLTDVIECYQQLGLLMDVASKFAFFKCVEDSDPTLDDASKIFNEDNLEAMRKILDINNLVYNILPQKSGKAIKDDSPLLLRSSTPEPKNRKRSLFTPALLESIDKKFIPPGTSVNVHKQGNTPGNPENPKRPKT